MGIKSTYYFQDERNFGFHAKNDYLLGKFIMVSQPIEFGRLVVSSGSIVLILFDTLIDVRLKLHHPKGGGVIK